MKSVMGAALLWLALASGAAARPAPQETVVEALVVTAAQPAPAWWEVRNGDSVVWILGGPMGPLPRDVKWDTGPLQKRLKGAKALILPSAATVGLGDLFSLLRLRGKLKEKTPLEPSLPEELRTRFAAARSALDKPAERYDGWTPVWAGRLLQQDYFDRWRLRGGESAVSAARQAARHEQVEVQRMTHRVLPTLKSAVEGMREDEKAWTCLGGYLDAVEVPPEHYRAAAQGWARGDVRSAIDLPRGGDICRELFLDEFTTESVGDQVETITTALQSPGAAVAIVPLRQLVVKKGVLQQLKARGFEITDPAELSD